MFTGIGIANTRTRSVRSGMWTWSPRTVALGTWRSAGSATGFERRSGYKHLAPNGAGSAQVNRCAKQPREGTGLQHSSQLGAPSAPCFPEIPNFFTAPRVDLSY